MTDALRELARRCGVATEYWDWQGRHVEVGSATIAAVLGALGWAAHTEQEIYASLHEVDLVGWRQRLPPVVVMRSGHPVQVPVHVPHGDPVHLQVRLEDGGEFNLSQVDKWVHPREVDGRLIGEATFELPGFLPLGWHELVAYTPSGDCAVTLVVTPHRLDLPTLDRQRWGWMTQLYSVPSRRSWGIGDLADLADLASWSGQHLRADFILVNPLHAAEPVAPMEPSPYLPTTRRFVNPLYIRVEDIPEIGHLDPDAFTTVRALAAGAVPDPSADQAPASAQQVGLIDRDAAWSAKLRALELIYRVPRSASRQAALAAHRRLEGDGLTGFATWCAIAEHLGLPAHEWPAAVRDPGSVEVAALATQLADRVGFYEWLQWIADEQLRAAQRAARESGMAFGIVHDLAVGVHPDGADTWALGSALARGVTVGAPPDAFNQQGQNWSQPPWRPDTLAASGYRPFRDMLRTVLRHAGGLRVDHVMGLFRLWWIPDGAGAGEGTYVRYDHEALLGIMCLEAHRAGAFLVGEDLGVVEPWVRDLLADRGVLGTSVLWFERDSGGAPLPPEHWRRLCLATVTTHDLPPTAGYLRGDHVELREHLQLLTRPVEEERELDAAEREAILQVLRHRQLLPADADEVATVQALYRYIALAPSVLIGVALTDAVGERRTQNQPGTCLEYPNWRMPLCDGAGRPVLGDDLAANDRVSALASAVRQD